MKNFKFNGKLYGIYIDYHENCLIKCYYKNDKREGDILIIIQMVTFLKSVIIKMAKEKENVFIIIQMVIFLISVIIKMIY
jgi:hypothetical protein